MDFSFIICTYNPASDILEKVISACLSQNYKHPDFELILVDNNSNPPLRSNLFVHDLAVQGKLKLLEQPKQGLAFARALGARTASGKSIVFVDDDNVTDHDYLTNLSGLQSEHPQVGVWGPGVVEISYYEGAPAWVKKHFAYLFQEKNRSKTEFGMEEAWPAYYPAGSGMCVSREVMESYLREFESGKLTLTGRSGYSLSSAEDSQIVWTAVKTGLSAGTSPALKLKHFIPAKRTTLSYLVRLNYGIAHSYLVALHEIFPVTADKIRSRSVLNKLIFTVRTLLKVRFDPVLFIRTYAIENAWYKGIDDARSFIGNLNSRQR